MTYEIEWRIPDAGGYDDNQFARILSSDEEWAGEMVTNLLRNGRTRITIQEVNS